MFVSRVGRPDISIATQRLCSSVAKWTQAHDEGLTRLMGYANREQIKVMYGELSPTDLEEVAINVYSDAVRNGDIETSKSTTGFWVEIFSPSSERSWPVSWGSVLQTSTSSSTAESETIAASYTMSRESFPIQILFEAATGRKIKIIHHIDNTQAITAIDKGHSKKLRHLPRPHRCSIGLSNECVKDPGLGMSVVHCPTAAMKADLITKVLDTTKFAIAVDMIGM